MLAASLAPRGDSAACPRPKTFYSCVGNRFSGCCSVDPCDLLGCPDDEGSSSGASSNKLGDRDPGSGDEDNGSGNNNRGGDGDERRLVSERSTAASSSTRTDSGITHTIPNHNVITVTRHTVVFSEAPSSTVFSTTLSSTPLPSDLASTSTTVAPAPPATSSARVDAGAGRPSEDVEAAGLSLGAIVGTVAGGIVFGVILVVLVVAWCRRKRSQAADADSAAAFQDALGGSNDAEKLHHQPMSAHTTGSSDPFAPFGGRADVPPDPYRPASGTFEMDGAGMAPVELPAESAAPSHAPGPQAAQQTYQPYGPAGGPAADPRANLNALKTDSGHATYVNHWNQWKALGTGADKS
ncbi:hypothetical protein G6O67_002567 [Ophiocordyceps sinensis]|uniref:Uncharacterized protein n=1 Tax=Ophiocordyceps sinensis TaxID=72228 RepID=A0A8H4V7D2_9HYPO|nr:hypothetical protein G6O67_002567 [Ophiocordyceps sinensis]